jgi:hypothetical protein
MVQWAQDALWISGIILQLLATAGMILRGSYLMYRAFFAYISFQAAKSLCLVFLRGNAWAYFWTYWIAEIVSLILALAVLQEIFEALVTHERRMQRFGRRIFWTVSAFALVIVATTIEFVPGTRESSLMTGVLTAEQSIRIVQCAVLVCIFGFAWISHVPWRPEARALALGMGIFIAAELLIVTMRQIYGPSFRIGFFLLKPLAYDIALIIWAQALVFTTKPAASETPSQSLAEMNQKLSGILQ